MRGPSRPPARIHSVQDMIKPACFVRSWYMLSLTSAKQLTLTPLIYP